MPSGADSLDSNACERLHGVFVLAARIAGMRDEAEIREQYEFLQEQLDSEEMNHEGVRQMFTYYKRALGWTLEEEYI